MKKYRRTKWTQVILGALASGGASGFFVARFGWWGILLGIAFGVTMGLVYYYAFTEPRISPDKAKELEEEIQRVRKIHEDSARIQERSLEQLEEANSLLGEAKEGAEGFHDRWQSQEVEVKHGPFKGWRGMVRSTYRPRVEVCFPKDCPHIERLWFYTADLQMIAR